MAWYPIELRHGATTVRVAGIDMFVANALGQWFAVEDRCSHANCAFSADGELDGTTLICNCHGSEFDVRTGRPLVMPAREAIRTFPIRESDSGLEVEL